MSLVNMYGTYISWTGEHYLFHVCSIDISASMVKVNDIILTTELMNTIATSYNYRDMYGLVTS